MPIKREQFKSGMGNIGWTILHFLASNSENAYNLKEIMQNINYYKDYTVILELLTLRSKGLVKEEMLDGEYYYIISKEALSKIEGGNI